MGVCSLEAEGGRVTSKSQGQVGVSVRNLRVLRAARMISRMSGAGGGNGDREVWETAWAIAVGRGSASLGQLFPKCILTPALWGC